MQTPHHLRSRLRTFLWRGLLYAARAVAGREAGAWPSADRQTDALMLPSPQAAEPKATAADSRTTIVPAPHWPDQPAGVPGR